MSEDLEIQVDEPEVESTEEDQTVTEQDKTEKRFSQEDLNRLVTNRVNREKQANKKLKEDYELQLSEKDTLLSQYENALKKIVEERAKDIPDAYRKLFDKLPIAEQLSFLEDPGNRVSKKIIPQTPKPSTELTEETPKKTTKKFL